VTIKLGTMELLATEPTDVIEDYVNGLQPDGGEWTNWTRLSGHDHSGGLLGAPVAVNIPPGSITADQLDPSVLAPYALTDGSRPFTGQVTMQADAIIRDTLYFGEQGTTLAPDVTLARTAAGKLRLDSWLGIGADVDAFHSARPALRIGGSAMLMGYLGGNALEMRTNSYQNASNQTIAIMAGVAGALALVNDTLTYSVAPNAAAGAVQAFSNRLAIDSVGVVTVTPNAGQPVILQTTRPQYTTRFAAGRPTARFGQWIDGAIAYITANGFYDGANWNLDDTTQDAVELHAYGAPGQPSFQVSRMMAGPNPITGPRTKNQFIVSSNGQVNIAPDAQAPAINVQGIISLSQWWGVDANSVRLQASTHVAVDPQSNYFLPARAGINCGSAANFWGTVYAQTGTIQPSSREAKQDITPLDPAVAMAAVRATEAVRFTYRGTPPPAPVRRPTDRFDWKAARQQQLQRPLQAAVMTQHGFTTEQADPLFITGGLSSPGNSIGVLLGALKNVDQRLTALEEGS
jgi:hypothetical protein